MVIFVIKNELKIENIFLIIKVDKLRKNDIVKIGNKIDIELNIMKMVLLNQQENIRFLLIYI